MIKKNFLLIAAFFSLLSHASFIALIGKQEKIEEQLISLNLSSFKELKKTAVSVPEKKNIQKTEEKKIEEKKIEKLIEPKTDVPKIKNEKKKKITKKQDAILPIKEPIITEKKVVKEIEKPKTFKKERLSTLENQKQTQSIKSTNQEKVTTELKKFLSLISHEINLIAMQSYPIQSIKRREQGTITTIIILDSKGNIKKMSFEKRKPKRLFKATEKIIKSYNFPPPPRIILNNKNEVKIKIPVNFILK